MVQHNHQYRRNIPPPPPRLPPRPPPRTSPTQQLTSSPSQAEKGIYRRQIGSEPSRRIKVLYALLAILFLLAQLQSVDLRDCFKPAIISESPRIEASDYHRFAINASAYLHLSDVKSILSDPISRMPNESSWLLEKDAIGFSETERSIRIPRTINKIYFQRDGKFDKKGMRDERLKRAHDTWPELNPGYEVRYFNLLHARQYLRQHFHPVFLRTFDCVQAFAGKCNFFRMALLYREGGFHSDWKEACLQPTLLDAISNETNFFAAADFGNPYAAASRSCAQNAFVGSVPRHQILAKYLELAMINVQSSHYPKNVLLTTGPCVFGRAIKQVDPEFGTNLAISRGKYGEYKDTHHFFWKGKKIVSHRCCGLGQDWENGNNYNTLFEKRKYYCEDSANIFDAI